MYTIPISVRELPDHPLDEKVVALLPPEGIPVIIGSYDELDAHVGLIPRPQDDIYPLGLRKPARQHHRSAVLTTTVGERPKDVEMEDGSSRLLVIAKGINMTRPSVGVTTDSAGNPYPYTYGLMGSNEIGDQFAHAIESGRHGVLTERPLGCLAIKEYVLRSERISHEELVAHVMSVYITKLAGLRISTTEKAIREEVARSHLQQPHIIALRGMEAALRLADVQDAPQLHLEEMLARTVASGESGLEQITIEDYFAWLQGRLVHSISGLHELELVHRGLYHGGNITTNGEIVDLDSVHRKSHYSSESEFEQARHQDIQDVASNIEQAQVAFNLRPDASIFQNAVAA